MSHLDRLLCALNLHRWGYSDVTFQAGNPWPIAYRRRYIRCDKRGSKGPSPFFPPTPRPLAGYDG